VMKLRGDPEKKPKDYSTPCEQELSYRKQIARQLRTQYVEGIHGPKYYTVTSKSRSVKVTGNGTIGQIIHDLLLVQLFDVKYYRDLEMWVRGQ